MYKLCVCVCVYPYVHACMCVGTCGWSTWSTCGSGWFLPHVQLHTLYFLRMFLQERPRIHFQRSVTVRLEKARTESQRSRYLRRNPVDPKKMDLVVPSAEVFTKMMIAFSGLLFMVRLGQRAKGCTAVRNSL